MSGTNSCRLDMHFLAKMGDIWACRRHVTDMSTTFPAKATSATVMRLMVDGNSNEAEKRGGGGGDRWGWRRRWRREAELEAEDRGEGERRRWRRMRDVDAEVEEIDVGGGKVGGERQRWR